MIIVSAKLTILFEEPFWVCLYEREENKVYTACKITFGAEPKDYEVYDFMLKNWNALLFSPPIKATGINEKHINPKRMQRLINKQTMPIGIGTKAQQALKLQQEQRKTVGKTFSRKQREFEKERQFELRQEKHKEKHKGH